MTSDNRNTAICRADFPAGFRWGTSTSSYQIEGAIHAGGRVESIWDRFCTRPGAIRDGRSGEVACDHYRRWPQDLDLARDLGTNAYRFSIAWPRIWTEAGTPNEQGLDFYERLVDGMLERGLQPWATLYHWDLPQALQDRGGWAARDTVYAYTAYVDAVTRRLGDRVNHWITHNEPWCTSMHGHWDGMHAPGIRDFGTALQVCHHVLLSHGLAVPVVRANAADAQVGIALSLHPVRTATDSVEDATAARRHDGLRNRWFLDPLGGRGYPADVLALLGELAPRIEAGDMATIAVPTDFMGLNYYFPETIAHAPGRPPLQVEIVAPPDVERTAFGWEVAPQGLTELLRRLHGDYGVSAIHITENGSCYDDAVSDGAVHDAPRTAYLVRHLAALRDALAEGIPVRGYFAWSLLDNFEWAEGYTRRFGLTHVDFATQQRLLKDSGHWYRAFLHGDA
ncbi:GH1 family beta-glucosidase [Pseudoduganella plicata]|uniref:Beta-glucosidase n=1 Tax=Pseudoduganella plicata TaxID=321984 RepID=A0A4P7BEN8_9BURK|nr:GH1 family beta-glucosidase [Pseudoduganella plicata]QBQ37206.1 beta-glucosidase [Pseudoduganella plicata]GGY98551.1 beta-glucosidase [Pseudoduganella plicata]